MKKLIVALIAFTIALTAVLPFPAFAADVNVEVNGEAVSFDTEPVIISGRTMIPARAVFEKMGASVLWDEYEGGGYVSVITPSESVVVYASKDGGEGYMIKDNFKKIGLDSPAVIRNGRTLVPLRAIGEAFGADVSWDDETRTASIEFEALKTVLSDEVVSANSALNIKDAGEKIKAEDESASFSPIPMYENGEKYFRGISVENKQEYLAKANNTLDKKEYKIFATINGTVIPYDEYDYYYKTLIDNAAYSNGGELTEENKKEIAENAEKDLYFLRVAAEKADEENIQYDKNYFDAANYFARMMTYGFPEKDYCRMEGISYETFNNIVEMYAKRNSLITKLTSEGIIDLSDEAIKNKFAEKFMKAKHILFKTTDDDNKKLSDSDLKKIDKLAKETLAKIKKGEDFDSLMKELSEDPGSDAYPEGYVFTDGEMVAEFENAVKSLKDNEVSDIVESVYGLHIIKRVALDPEKEEDTISNYASSIANGILLDYINNNIEEWKSGMEIVKF